MEKGCILATRSGGLYPQSNRFTYPGFGGFWPLFPRVRETRRKERPVVEVPALQTVWGMWRQEEDIKRWSELPIQSRDAPLLQSTDENFAQRR